MEKGNAFLNILLADYRGLLEQQKKELRRMPPGSLIITKDGRSSTYMQLIPASEKTGGKRIRKGITKNPELVRRLARKKYLSKSTRLLTAEIQRIDRFLKESVEPTADNVLKLLPKSYQTVPRELFFPEKQTANKWEAEPYEQNTFHAEEKIHTTGRGIKVRSKSELMIADKLDLQRLPYRYDALIYSGQYTFSPDFMILTTEGIKYWEHCGMMGEPKYRKRNQWKLAMYDRMGIAPWKNLIITYDSEDGGLNLGIIQSEIENKLLPIKI